MRAFRLALGAAVLLVVAALLGSAYPLAIVVTALVVPILTVVYAYDVDVYEDAPLRVVVLTAAWGGAAGVALAAAARVLAPAPADVLSRSAVETLVIEAVVFPLIGLGLAAAGPLLLLLDRRFDDVLDGVTFGTTSAVWLSGSVVLVTSSALFDDGLRPGGSLEEWSLRLVALAVAGPLLWAGFVGGAVGRVLLASRADSLSARLGRSAAALALAAAAVVAGAAAQVALPLQLAVPALVALAAGGLVWLRRSIHVGLLEEAREHPVGAAVTCANCDTETPRHTYCGHCGIAVRALPKTRVADIDEAFAYVSGMAAARLHGLLVPALTTAGVLVLSGAAAVAVLVAAPSPPAPTCAPGEPCGGPPSTAPLVEQGAVWRGDGLSVAYDSGRWTVEEETSDRITLRRSGGAAWLEIFATRYSSGRPTTVETSGPRRVRGMQRLEQPLYAPGLGYVDGVGAWYAGFLDTPQSPREAVTIAAMAARRRGLSVAANAVFFVTSEELFGDGENRALRGEVDSILNTVRWVAGSGAPTSVEPSRGPRRAAAAAGPPDRVLGHTPARRPIDLSLTLASPRRAEFSRLVRSLNEPGPRNHRGFMTAELVGTLFGPAPSTLRDVVRRLRGAGVRTISLNPQRTVLRAKGSARDVGDLFHVTLLEVEGADGSRFRRPDRTPRIPSHLRGVVDGVLGLDTKPPLSARPRFVADSTGGLLPRDVAQAYEVLPLWRAGIRGQGQTVAVVSLDGFRDEDIAAFDQLAGTEGAPPVERVFVTGKPAQLGPGALEVSLDIEVVRGLAPEATIISYEAPLSWQGFVDALSSVNADGRADLVSVSWGKCSDRVPDEVIRAMEREHEIAVAAGRTIFVASGDSGAFGCLHTESELDGENHVPSVDWPAASPNVVAVGGTRLSVRADGSYFSENAWEDALSNRATGGGVSERHSRPAWQRGRGLDGLGSARGRLVPDVAGPADCDSAFVVVFPRLTGEGPRQTTAASGCGTSAAAPFWAAIAALSRQYAERNGVRLGFLAPLLYELGRDRRSKALRDVQTGGNLDTDAGPGWDFATGLGTPRASVLVRELRVRAALGNLG